MAGEDDPAKTDVAEKDAPPPPRGAGYGPPQEMAYQTPYEVIPDVLAEAMPKEARPGEATTHDQKGVEYVPWPLVADELDKLCGVGGWRMVETEVKEVPRGNGMELVWIGELQGNYINPPIHTTGNGTFFPGGGGPMGWSDAYQAAESRALNKAAARIGIYRHVWLKEQQRSLEAEAGATRQERRAPAPRPAGLPRSAPAKANGQPKASSTRETPLQTAKRVLGIAAREEFGLKKAEEMWAMLGLTRDCDDPMQRHWWEPALKSKVSPKDAGDIAIAALRAVKKEMEQNEDNLPAAVDVVNPLGLLERAGSIIPPPEKKMEPLGDAHPDAERGSKPPPKRRQPPPPPPPAPKAAAEPEPPETATEPEPEQGQEPEAAPEAVQPASDADAQQTRLDAEDAEDDARLAAMKEEQDAALGEEVKA